MITVKDLIKQLEKQPQDAYVAIKHASDDVDSWLAQKGIDEVVRRVDKDSFYEFDDQNDEFKKEYDENRYWIVIG